MTDGIRRAGFGNQAFVVIDPQWRPVRERAEDVRDRAYELVDTARRLVEERRRLLEESHRLRRRRARPAGSGPPCDVRDQELVRPDLAAVVSLRGSAVSVRRRRQVRDAQGAD
ncbi:hypothetical protein [Streptomyces sp. NRRL B-1347]|uniref:hypothetical protein n=1 Tax=Streptomyces sp. NRRL B-1347 TaxID=1476877 RepID=UPI00131AAF75|nr:hypothetical protein [Streptomyces sp. NRRL B-1347]